MTKNYSLYFIFHLSEEAIVNMSTFKEQNKIGSKPMREVFSKIQVKF